MSVNKVAQKWEPKYHGEGKKVREGKRSRSVGTVGKCIETRTDFVQRPAADMKC